MKRTGKDEKVVKRMEKYPLGVGFAQKDYKDRKGRKRTSYFCVECFKRLDNGHICDKCQELLSNPPWDIEKDDKCQENE